MADDPQNPAGQVPAGTDPTQQTSTTPAVSDPPNPTTPEQVPGDEEFNAERAQALIRKLRDGEKQAAKERKELESLRAERKAAEDAKLSEQERLTQRQKQLETELEQERKLSRDRDNRYQVQLQAQKLGIVDPEAAEKLLDWDSLSYDDKGRPTDLPDALKQLVKDRPWLAGTAQALGQGQPTTPAVATTNGATRAGSTTAPVYTAAQLGDYEFYTKNRDDIILAGREGRIRG